ncbi:MAG: hypothetical protein FWD68_08720 [Alphaproteobacteria bacterium]|nr:hypothetical protein [Alphaproteobacteria bacterium]
MSMIRNLILVALLASLLAGCGTIGCGVAGGGSNRGIGICGVGGRF